MPEFAPGDVFVGHRIEGPAGRGGMGVVYRATQLDLARTVALKVIAPALADDPDFRARFVAESKAAASIEHPNVLPVYSAGDHDGVLYIAMRYVDGPDLRALVRASEALGPERAAHIVAQVGAALDAAHGHGLVHRDVKPANVLVDAQEHAYLADFGLTKRLASTAALSRSGSWVGTLGYVAPEQIRGDRVDARTDVYALGCVLVHALTGRAPYVRESDEATMWAHLNAPPPTEAVPPEFAGVVARALAKDPSERYPSAGDLGRAALAAAGRSGVAAPERVVARGAAAPPELAHGASGPDEETRPSPPHEQPTDGEHLDRTAWTRRPDGRRPRRRGAALTAAALLAAGVVVALLLGSSGDGDRGGEPQAARRSDSVGAARPKRLVAGNPIAVSTRPNSITVSHRYVWALSARAGEIAPVNATTRRPEERVEVGRGASSIASGFGSLWVSKLRTRSLLRVDPDTRRRGGAAIAIDAPGLPIAVATGAGAVWVAMHDFAGGPGYVVKVIPRTGAQTSIPVQEGVQDIAVGERALWVSTRGRASVVRIGTRDLRATRIPVGRSPHGLAVGAGAVWVAATDDDAITRIDARSLRTRSIALPVTPERVAVGGGSVWVTALTAARLIRIDPRRRRVRDSVDTGRRPFALDVGRDAVWVTLVGDNAVQRIPFER